MNNQIEEIIYAHLSGEDLSIDEKDLFNKWLSDSENKHEYERLVLLRKHYKVELHINKVDSKISWCQLKKRLSKHGRINISYMKILRYAAAIILPMLFLLGAFYVVDYKANEELTYEETPIIPGKSQATLTLASGDIVALSEKQEGIIFNKQGKVIAQETNNTLVYDKRSRNNTEEYNKITVPRGGEFQLTLGDGTKVWLNSETELKYPVHFIGKERKIYLKGEAFFKVAHNKNKPFIVSSERQNVQVYGTSFNVKDYNDEEFVQTTLAEGSVKVTSRKFKNSRFIKPGEQAFIGNNKFSVRKVDVNQYISWKEGEFTFKQERLDVIMKKISRWYDVDIFYLNKDIKNYHFTAWFKKDKGIDYVVEQLKATNKLEVRIKNRTIILSDKIR